MPHPAARLPVLPNIPGINARGLRYTPDPTQTQSRNCAGRRSSSRARLAQHPQSPIACLSLSCVFASSPPHYATLKASPKFPKIPTPVLLFSSFCIRTGPCNLWHLPTAPPPSHASLMFPASPRRPHRFCPSGQAVSRLRTTIAPITRLQRAEAATAPAVPKE